METITENYHYYLPTNYLNSNYYYDLNSDYITIHTNSNCFTQYNTTYCDCFRVYPNYNYIKSNNYSCAYNSGNYLSSYNSFSSDFKDSPYFFNIFIVYFIYIFIVVKFLLLFYKVFRKRVK